MFVNNVFFLKTDSWFICYKSFFIFLYFTVYFTKVLGKKSILEGHDVHFVCQGADKCVLPKWFKEEKEIMDSKKYTMRVNGYIYQLDIKDADIEDSGKYAVTINKHTNIGTLEVEGTLF